MPKLQRINLFICMVVIAFSLTSCQMNQEAQKQYWAAGTGTMNQTPLWIALGASFVFCELINAGMRRSKCDTRTFNATVWLSYPVCIGAPMIGAYASRYLLLWLNLASPIYFVLLNLAIALPLCILGTNWVIHYGYQHVEELSRMP